MRHTQLVPTLIAMVALAVALAAMLGGRTDPVAASTLVAQIEPAAALGGGFTYQGSLSRGGQLVNGVDACNLRFSLWDAASGGAQQGGAQTVSGVDFAQGLFTVTLNDAAQFGPAAFDGQARWLQVEAACPGGAFASLGRQAITAAPYATHSGSTGALQGRPVSAAAPTAGQVLRWDGSAWAPAPAFVQTIVVSPRATPAESGAALVTTLQVINDASANKPYLLKIEPGVYDLGTSTLQMKPYVDVEGSGQGVTLLRGDRQGDDVTGLVNATNNTELRQLSVEVARGSGTFAVGISSSAVSPRITDVTIRTDGATSYGIVSRNGSSPRVERVTSVTTGSTVRGAGFAHFNAGTPTITHSALRVTATAGNGAALYVDGLAGGNPTVSVFGGSIEGVDGVEASNSASARLYNVRLKASGIGFRFGPSATVLVAGSELDLPFIIAQGSLGFTLRCIGSYKPDLTPLNSNCAPS